jgi:acyl-CoA synthetase (AMP-forming)/AMP-acid ligase II
MTENRTGWSTLADKLAVEATPLADRLTAETVYAMLRKTAAAHPNRPAISFQIKSGPRDKAETLDWTQLTDRVTRTANLFRRLGIGEGDVVAYLLPNCNEVVLALLGGATAGIVNPINPLLDVAQIAALLRESGARALVTLAPFPNGGAGAFGQDRAGGRPQTLPHTAAVVADSAHSPESLPRP